MSNNDFDEDVEVVVDEEDVSWEGVWECKCKDCWHIVHRWFSNKLCSSNWGISMLHTFVDKREELLISWDISLLSDWVVLDDDEEEEEEDEDNMMMWKY